MAKLRLGASACLLGERVRYDGGHKRDASLVDGLGALVEWVPVCPEVEVGLGVPREPIQLVGSPASPRLVAERSGTDHTGAMLRFAEARVRALGALDLDGYVTKRDSPSCGLEGVPVRAARGEAPRATGSGLFARVLTERMPLLPIEEEARLADPAARERFVARVLAYHRSKLRRKGPTMASFSSVNPATGEVLARVDEISDAEIDARLARAAQTFRSWRRRPFAERAALMNRAADLLEQRKEHWARTMTLEMGKTFKSAVAEAEKCAWACRFYAENAERFLADEEVKASATRSFVRCLPIGPVLAVMPWNFPFWQVFRFAAPALMAGNVGLLKHASNVPQSALAIEEIFRLAGFPDGCFQTLLVGSARVAKIIEDERVAAVTLTGSEGAGAAVAAAAGKVIKKTVLELGGSDPFVVMPSANLDAALKTAVTARVINNGQSCIAAKRFIVHDRIYDRFEREMVQRMAALRVGDPMDPATDVGPLASGAELEKLSRQVDAAVRDGAHLLTGGKPPGGKGFYYPPTVLAAIPRSSPAYREEIFGPVAMLHRVKDADEAIAVANDVPFGLGSSVWTNDEGERRRFVDDLEAGATFVNAMVASDPRLPFGGVKRSGYGRELARDGIREFVNVKTVVVQELAPPKPQAGATE